MTLMIRRHRHVYEIINTGPKGPLSYQRVSVKSRQNNRALQNSLLNIFLKTFKLSPIISHYCTRGLKKNQETL